MEDGGYMLNFEFSNPTKILFGKGQIAALSNEIAPGAKVMITYGGGSVTKNGVLAQVKQALGSRAFVEFGGIEPNPEYATLMQAVAAARRERIDLLLAVGGGAFGLGVTLTSVIWISHKHLVTKANEDALNVAEESNAADAVKRLGNIDEAIDLPKRKTIRLAEDKSAPNRKPKKPKE